MDEAKLWVRPEVLESGVLPILPSDKVSVKMLSRLLQYAKDLGIGGYPRISYDVWKHIAVKKMGLSVECAMVVFFTCLLFSQLDPGYFKKLEADLASNSTQNFRDNVLGDAEVWTLELVILLYLHRVNNAHPRAIARQASLQSLTTDPWPEEVSATSRKQLLEERNGEFLREALPELLSLLAGHLYTEDVEKKKKGGEKRPTPELLSFMKSAGVLSVDVVQSLNFIIGASITAGRNETEMLKAATNKQTCYHSGFLSKKNAFQKGLFEQWVLRGLDWAPHGEWLCVRRGRTLSWPVVSLVNPLHHRLVATPSPGKQRLAYVCELMESLTAHVGEETAMCDLKVRRCNKSNIYILQPLRHAVIHKCHDCRIVLGPVNGRLKISECRNTVVVCPARSVVVNDSRSVVVHTLTPQRPLLVGGRIHGVTLAPLNVHYPKLLHHLSAISLQSHINMWNRPLHLGADGVLTGSYDVMVPEDFHLLAVPFSDSPMSPVDGRPPLLPPGLPSQFVKSVELARQNVASFRNEVKDADLTPEQRISLQKAIDARFKLWLRDTGKQRELDQLEKMSTLLKFERVTRTTAI